MAVAFPAGTVLLFVFDDEDLGTAADLYERSGDFGFGDVGGADRCVLAIVHHEDLVEGDLLALFVGAGELLDGDEVAFRDGILLASGGEYGEFHRGHTIHEWVKKGNPWARVRLKT